MYCTLEDLTKQLPVETLLSLTSTDDDEIDTEVTDKAILDAGAEIDGYAAKQYKVPFKNVPAVIRKFAVDIALYNLFSRRGFSEDTQDEVIILRYKAAIKFLENLAKGIVQIGAAEVGDSTSNNMSQLTAATIKNEARIFTRTKMRGY